MQNLKDSFTKKSSIRFLQVVIVLIAIGVLTLMFLEPQSEGRNVNATMFEIYFRDPFLAYAYISSIPFFVALYKAFKVLGYAAQNMIFSSAAVKAIQAIKYCSISIIGFVAIGAAYLFIFNRGEDDIAGGIAISIVMIFIALVTATAATMFERVLQNAVEMKSENDLTV